MIAIPTETDVSQWTQTTQIEGTEYTLTFQHSQRENRYYLTVLRGDAVLVRSCKVVCSFPLVRVAAGTLICVATDGTDTPPLYGELGGRCTLLYVADSEL